MTQLHEYQQRRLALGDMLRAAMHIARRYHDDEIVDATRRLLRRLAEDRFELAVIGQFSRGKSTLMNAILGGDYLPTGALPMTSVITSVGYGSRPRAFVHRQGSSLPLEQPINAVARFVAQASSERAELQISAVDIEVPAEILRLGFYFVDTPGIGSAIELNTATTKRFLPRADAVIFVTGFDSPMTAAELEFLADARQYAHKFFCVINKRDLVPDSTAAEVVRFVGHQMADLGFADQSIFPLSALEAVEARLTDDRARLAASRVLAFETTLREFLTREKAELFLANIGRQTEQLLHRQHRDLRLGRASINRDAVTTKFGTEMHRVDDRLRQLAEDISDRIGTALPDALAPRTRSWPNEVRALVAEPVAAALDRLTNSGSSLRDERERLQDAAMQHVLADWVRGHAGEVHELIVGLVAPQIGELLTSAHSPGSLGADLAGFALPGEGVRPTGWSTVDIPAASAPVVHWELSDVPTHWRRRSTSERLADAIDSAVPTFVDRTIDAFVTIGLRWAERLRDQTVRTAHLGADRFRRNLSTDPADEDLDALDTMLDRLAAFAAEPLQIAAEDPAVETTPVGKGDVCVVCARLEETLSDCLRHEQYRLATRERDQQAHAEIGGYCQLHTWEYAAMASPIGISAGYARLAEFVAATLDSFQAAGKAELTAGLAKLLANERHCPVCTALRDAEAVAIANVPADVPLCVRHLALTTAGVEDESARAMVRALAARLHRQSEDMRAYTLKREALHSGLVTQEESTAYQATLQLLAGQPALVRPWFVHGE